jgi:Flp pilus assembly protein TadD
VSHCAITVLYTAKPSAEQCQQVARWLEEAITKNPKKTALLEDLAAVRRLQGRFQDAITLYRQMLAQNEADTLTLNNLAWLLALQDRNGTEALKVIERAIEIGGPLAELLDTRGVIHLTMGQSQSAITDLKEAIADTPTAHRCFHLAQAHDQARERDAAVRALRQAKSLGLTESTVDPLEALAYRQVLAALDRR